MSVARSSSMSPALPVGTPDTSLELQDESISRRRVSSRVRSKPSLLSDKPYHSQATNGVKRKRAELHDEDLENLSEE